MANEKVFDVFRTLHNYSSATHFELRAKLLSCLGSLSRPQPHIRNFLHRFLPTERSGVHSDPLTGVPGACSSRSGEDDLGETSESLLASSRESERTLPSN